jgi:hypothetical protein
MFDKLRQAFSSECSGQPIQTDLAASNIALTQFLQTFCGCTFDRGIYRSVNGNTFQLATDFIKEAFPAYTEKVWPFAYDWTGNIFGVSPKSATGHVYMFEPGSGEAMESPFDIVQFHDAALVDDRDGALAGDYFEEWFAIRQKPLPYENCIGYKKPLFLGGTEDDSNSEESDVDVYWTLMGQLIAKTKGLKPGTPIGKVSGSDDKSGGSSLKSKLGSLFGKRS